MRRLALLVTALACVCAQAVKAEHKALMIGVMNYSADQVGDFGTLGGPGPDVALMTQVFVDMGVEAQQLTVLTDAPEFLRTDGITSSVPDRANILAALNRLADNASPGDLITIYMAGHGAQIPAGATSGETDGFDEVFLPADFGFDADGAPSNVVLDDEIGTKIDRMIAAGAHVWLIADTCHSGSFRRDAGIDLVARFVDLNRDNAPVAGADTLADISLRGAQISGQFTGFYGAAAGALAYEAKVAGSDTPHGLLTWALAQAIREARATTFSDLARQVTSNVWTVGFGRAEPQFEGALGAAHVFSERGVGAGRFALSVDEGVTVAAGRVDGIVPGTVLWVLDQAETPLFEVAVNDVSLTQSTGSLPVGALPELDEKLTAEGLDPTRFRLRWLQDRAPVLTAEVKSRPADLSFSVGLSLSGVDAAVSERIAQMVTDLGPRLRLEQNRADLHIIAEDDLLVLHPTAPGARQVMTIPIEPTQLPRLRNILQQYAKSRSLVSVAQSLQSSELANNLTVSLHQRAGQAGEGGDCIKLPDADAAPQDPSPGVPRVSHCDTVSVTIQNRNPWPVDLTPLYVAPDNQVYFLSGYRDAAKGGWRIGAGETDTLRYVEATQKSDGSPLATGPMRLVILAERGFPGAVPTDFRYLQSSAAPPATRSADPASFTALLTEAGFGQSARRSIGETVMRQSGAVVLPLKTIREEGKDRVAE